MLDIWGGRAYNSLNKRKGDFKMNEMWEVGCEEIYTEETAMPIFVAPADLPSATYIGGDEWVGLDGTHYIVWED